MAASVPAYLIYVIGECLVKIDRLLCSAIRQGFHELRNFSDAIVRQGSS
jgi:hypothetical protein